MADFVSLCAKQSKIKHILLFTLADTNSISMWLLNACFFGSE